MVSENKYVDWIRGKYGEWAVRYSEGFFLYGAFSSGLTSFWIMQRILSDSFQIEIPLWQIVSIFVVCFSLIVYLMDKVGFIEARQNAMAVRNKYFRKIK